VLSHLQAMVIGVTQGVTELIPISSLGHSVLIPALIGGSWKDLATQSSTGDSGHTIYLAFIVALHVATAVALLSCFRSEWVRIIRGFLTSLRPSIAARRLIVRDDDERLVWLLVIATIPAGLTEVLVEHTFRTIFAKPLLAAVFLNRQRRGAAGRRAVAAPRRRRQRCRAAPGHGQHRPADPDPVRRPPGAVAVLPGGPRGRGVPDRGAVRGDQPQRRGQHVRHPHLHCQLTLEGSRS